MCWLRDRVSTWSYLCARISRRRGIAESHGHWRSRGEGLKAAAEGFAGLPLLFPHPLPRRRLRDPSAATPWPSSTWSRRTSASGSRTASAQRMGSPAPASSSSGPRPSPCPASGSARSSAASTGWVWRFSSLECCFLVAEVWRLWCLFGWFCGAAAERGCDD